MEFILSVVLIYFHYIMEGTYLQVEKYFFDGIDK